MEKKHYGAFLGLIFVFYMIFPFFCVLLERRRRAWLAFVVSLVYNFVCVSYFGVGRSNILYSGCFFLAGGLLYIYREELSGLNRWIASGVAGGAVLIYYAFGGNTGACLLVSTALLSYTIVCGGYWRIG